MNETNLPESITSDSPKSTGGEILSIHVFTGVENFAQFLELNNLKEGAFEIFKETLNANRVYKETCCNKNTFLRIANEIYLDCLKKNKENTEIWNLLKDKTKTSKLMFYNSKSEPPTEIYTV